MAGNDVFLYAGQANPNDVTLRDPTVAGVGGAASAGVGVNQVEDIPQTGAASVAVTGSGSSSTVQTTSGSGAITLAGSGINTLSNVTQVGTGTAPLPGANATGANTVANDTQTAVCSVTISAIGANSTAHAVSGAGAVAIAGSGINKTQQASSAAGNVAITGTGSTTTGQASDGEGAVQVSGAGTSNIVVAGTGTGQVGAMSPIIGSGNSSLGDVTQMASGIAQAATEPPPTTYLSPWANSNIHPRNPNKLTHPPRRTRRRREAEFFVVNH